MSSGNKLSMVQSSSHIAEPHSPIKLVTITQEQKEHISKSKQGNELVIV